MSQLHESNFQPAPKFHTETKKARRAFSRAAPARQTKIGDPRPEGMGRTRADRKRCSPIFQH